MPGIKNLAQGSGEEAGGDGGALDERIDVAVVNLRVRHHPNLPQPQARRNRQYKTKQARSKDK